VPRHPSFLLKLQCLSLSVTSIVVYYLEPAWVEPLTRPKNLKLGCKWETVANTLVWKELLVVAVRFCESSSARCAPDVKLMKHFIFACGRKMNQLRHSQKHFYVMIVQNVKTYFIRFCNTVYYKRCKIFGLRVSHIMCTC
jgi:hypothetical protein